MLEIIFLHEIYNRIGYDSTTQEIKIYLGKQMKHTKTLLDETSLGICL